jgi:DNA-binding NarL/FixJ family response regulator
MTDSTVNIVLLDADPIFRIGLRTSIEKITQVKVVAEVDAASIWQVLPELTASEPWEANLVVLELVLVPSQSSYQPGLQLCQQLKSQYPRLPLFLLTSVREPTILATAKAIGVDGYCPKGTALSELVAAMGQVAAGGSYWFGEQEISALTTSYDRGFFPSIWRRSRLSGISYIDANLQAVRAQLQVPGLPILDRAVLAGKRRELLAARWLLVKLFATGEAMPQPVAQQAISPTATVAIAVQPAANITPKNLQTALFEATNLKLQFSLQNLTELPLEIDIFREDRKRDLLKLILVKFANVLDNLRLAQVENYQIEEKAYIIIADLWQAVITDYFGKYSTLKIGNNDLEIVNFLLQDTEAIQREILYKIPLVVDLLYYLLFETNLAIDNASYPANSPEARERAEIILQNLLIQLANGVVQPLLNRLADVEAIKQTFYDRKLISTREIERFRNSLSWKYRWRDSVTEAKAIFESRYDVLVLVPRGIAQISIYAPRRKELAQLSGIPLAVTIALEFRDAIAPRIRAVVSFIGSGIVYVLTQVVGRAIGLIGRGILQGMGGSLAESKNRKF